MNAQLRLMIFVTMAWLAGCGGSDSNSGNSNDGSVSGTASGLAGTATLALVTSNNQEQITVNGSRFSFQQPLANGERYEVVIRQPPAGQACSLSNATGVGGQFLAPVNLTCNNLSTSQATVSGTISLASNTVPDSDLNDPFSEFADNSTFSTAQAIENLVTVQGFVTEVPTRNFSSSSSDRSGDRFANSTDRDDYFSVTLQEGQILQLQVVDYDDFNLENTFAGDLDLYLYDDAFTIVERSISETEFEEIIVPASGQYLVNVYAFSGASKYVLTLKSAASGRMASTRPMGDFMPNEAIVQFEDSGTPLVMTASAAVSFHHTQFDRATLARFSNTQAAASSLTNQNPAMQELATLNPESYEKVMTLKRIKTMSQTPGVAYAEPNYMRYIQRIPNDELYNLQWHYPAMNLPQAWDITTGTPASGDVIVAVVDTGLVLSHPDLSGKLVPGFDFIVDSRISRDSEFGIDNNPDDPGDGAIGSSSWHGTHVSGTVAADTNNRIGVAGVSWGAKVMPLRALGRGGGSIYDIMQAVRYAAGLPNDSGTVPAQRADIINLSLGGGGYSAINESVFQEIHSLGIIVVAAAGNENTSELSYPASYEGVISVSALDFNNNRAPYSNFGSAIDIAAPGGNMRVDNNNDGRPDGVLSTLVDDSSGSRQPILDFSQGTSMASPHVAGMFALMKAVYPGLTSADVDSLLQSGALTTDAGSPGRDNTYGFGIADALKAVQAAQSLAGGQNPPELPSSLVPNPSGIAIGTGSSAQFTISNQGGGNPAISGVTTDASWLSVAAVQVDNNGLGSYTASVDRSGLGDGLYLGNITLTADNSSSIIVRVSMAVGQIDTGGNLAELYILLYDPEREDTAYQIQGRADESGNLSYSLPNVSAGEYLIYAGTDVDNDGLICQSGEGCGSYPTLGDALSITVNGSNVDGIDFITEIVAGFGNINSLAEEEDKPKPKAGIPKLSPTKKAIGQP